MTVSFAVIPILFIYPRNKPTVSSQLFLEYFSHNFSFLCNHFLISLYFFAKVIFVFAWVQLSTKRYRFIQINPCIQYSRREEAYLPLRKKPNYLKRKRTTSWEDNYYYWWNVVSNKYQVHDEKQYVTYVAFVLCGKGHLNN